MTHVPDWIIQLAEQVADRFAPVDPVAPLGCHFHRTDDVWEVSVFAADTEIVGGAHDGRRRPSRFVLDVMPLISLFDQVFDITWQPTRFEKKDQLGGHVAIIGTYRGELVCLRILSRAPAQFPPGRRANVHQGVWENLWQESE